MSRTAFSRATVRRRDRRPRCAGGRARIVQLLTESVILAFQVPGVLFAAIACRFTSAIPPAVRC
jgi:hypothetical protein